MLFRNVFDSKAIAVPSLLGKEILGKKEEERRMGDETHEVEALVISNGSYLTKAGIAGDDAPRAVFPTTIADIRRGGMGYFAAQFISDKANGIRAAKWPIKDGVVTGSWDDMESIWQHTFANELTVASEGKLISYFNLVNVVYILMI